MTEHKSFKRLVRARMDKTGESYTAARAQLLQAPEPEPADVATSAPPALATSDERIRERTGRGWEEWFDLLDDWGAAERTHREIARWVAERQGIDPLAWNAQAVVSSYERARGLRAVGEHADGFTVTASRTVAVAVARLYEAVVDAARREEWLPGADLRERTAQPGRSARFDWGYGPGRVHVFFAPKGEERSTVSLQHVRLADAAEAERTKAFWRERLGALKARLEG
jgi:hypothetical protein